RLLECRGMDLVEVDPETCTVSFTRPGVSLDLGAIGKGYAADQIAKLLKDRGVEAGAILSGRSTVLAWGLPAEEESWQVEVCHPGNEDESLCQLEMRPGALSTSSAAERFVRSEGKTYGHIIDPRDGLPTSAIEGATIWTPQAALGDVLSTALFILGREALAENGCAEKLVRAWTPQGEAPRASIILAEKSSGAWGGVEWEAFHIGEPGFEASD
nr:FAD:protein FMN transferase [Planctomycetota bacterium]